MADTLIVLLVFVSYLLIIHLKGNLWCDLEHKVEIFFFTSSHTTDKQMIGLQGKVGVMLSGIEALPPFTSLKTKFE